MPPSSTPRWRAHIRAPKSAPEEVVRQVLTAIEEGREEAPVDEVTRTVKRGMVAELPSSVRA